ncbi:MAG: MmcQ/YjbR family DNA-binding protein [Emticicia sp.]|nr:MmcQ/YjbR family DNA-binding protein [Emticicia sp.]
MDLESFREFCLLKRGVTEELPFGPDTLVYKVMGKIFALTNFDFDSINIKNSPEKNQELRANYDLVVAGYHMSKVHWNTISTRGSIKDALLREWIDESYEIVVKGLPKKVKEELLNL